VGWWDTVGADNSSMKCGDLKNSFQIPTPSRNPFPHSTSNHTDDKLIVATSHLSQSHPWNCRGRIEGRELGPVIQHHKLDDKLIETARVLQPALFVHLSCGKSRYVTKVEGTLLDTSILSTFLLLGDLPSRRMVAKRLTLDECAQDRRTNYRYSTWCTTTTTETSRESNRVQQLFFKRFDTE
jgi:hypothetical protein